MPGIKHVSEKLRTLGSAAVSLWYLMSGASLTSAGFRAAGSAYGATRSCLVRFPDACVWRFSAGFATADFGPLKPRLELVAADTHEDWSAHTNMGLDADRIHVASTGSRASGANAFLAVLHLLGVLSSRIRPGTSRNAASDARPHIFGTDSVTAELRLPRCCAFSLWLGSAWQPLIYVGLWKLGPDLVPTLPLPTGTHPVGLRAQPARVANFSVGFRSDRIPAVSKDFRLHRPGSSCIRLELPRIALTNSGPCSHGFDGPTSQPPAARAAPVDLRSLQARTLTTHPRPLAAGAASPIARALVHVRDSPGRAWECTSAEHSWGKLHKPGWPWADLVPLQRCALMAQSACLTLQSRSSAQSLHYPQVACAA